MKVTSSNFFANSRKVVNLSVYSPKKATNTLLLASKTSSSATELT